VVDRFFISDLRKVNPEVNWAADQNTCSKCFHYDIYRLQGVCRDWT